MTSLIFPLWFLDLCWSVRRYLLGSHRVCISICWFDLWPSVINTRCPFFRKELHRFQVRWCCRHGRYLPGFYLVWWKIIVLLVIVAFGGAALLSDLQLGVYIRSHFVGGTVLALLFTFFLSLTLSLSWVGIACFVFLRFDRSFFDTKNQVTARYILAAFYCSRRDLSILRIYIYRPSGVKIWSSLV